MVGCYGEPFYWRPVKTSMEILLILPGECRPCMAHIRNASITQKSCWMWLMPWWSVLGEVGKCWVLWARRKKQWDFPRITVVCCTNEGLPEQVSPLFGFYWGLWRSRKWRGRHRAGCWIMEGWVYSCPLPSRNETWEKNWLRTEVTYGLFGIWIALRKRVLKLLWMVVWRRFHTPESTTCLLRKFTWICWAEMERSERRRRE